jgi:hypothetical protein
MNEKLETGLIVALAIVTWPRAYLQDTLAHLAIKYSGENK